MKNKIRNGIAVWSLIIIAVYPALFLYGQNTRELSLQEAMQAAVLLLAVYGVAFGVSLCVIRKCARAALYTLVLIILGNYFTIFLKMAQWLVPGTKYWHMLSIVLAVGFVLIPVFKKRISDEFVGIGVLGLSILANFFFVINLVPAALAATKEATPTYAAVNNNAASRINSPNIYYLVFDEFSSNEFMNKYYNYDNGKLVMELEKLGFNVSLSSSNEAYMTKICMTNTFNLDYLFDMDDNDDKSMDKVILEKRKNNLLFEILFEKGYQIQAIGEADFYGLEDASAAAAIEKTTLEGKSFKQLIFQKTAFYPFIRDNLSVKLESIIKNRDYIKNLNLVPNSGNFVLFHVELPHEVFVVDQGGRLVSVENRLNWRDKKYYLGQYQYASDMMLDIVSKLIEKDKDAVIVLSSDHSARAREEFRDIDKCQIFNSVYFQGRELDIEGLSGINTLRKLLNELFDFNFEMLSTTPLEPVEE